jgi:hypothetical protein
MGINEKLVYLMDSDIPPLELLYAIAVSAVPAL